MWNIEALAIKIKLRKVKRTLVCFYNPYFSNLAVHISAMDKAIEFYSKTYDNISIGRDFIVQVKDTKLDTFSSI